MHDKESRTVRHEIDLPVQFRDFDVLGHVNSTVYLQWMETARVGLVNRIAAQQEWYRVPIVVVAARCEYKQAIHHAEKVRVSTWVSRIGDRSWDLDYEVATQEDGVSTIGRTTQVAFDHDSGKVIAIGDLLREGLQGHRAPPLDFRT